MTLLVGQKLLMTKLNRVRLMLINVVFILVNKLDNLLISLQNTLSLLFLLFLEQKLGSFDLSSLIKVW